MELLINCLIVVGVTVFSVLFVSFIYFIVYRVSEKVEEKRFKEYINSPLIQEEIEFETYKQDIKVYTQLTKKEQESLEFILTNKVTKEMLQDLITSLSCFKTITIEELLDRIPFVDEDKKYITSLEQEIDFIVTNKENLNSEDLSWHLEECNILFKEVLQMFPLSLRKIRCDRFYKQRKEEQDESNS